MPAERAKGRFANRAMHTQPIADTSAVAVKTAPLSIPDADRIPGLTARI